MRPIERVKERLEGVKSASGGYQARCPAHDDRKPSLSINESPDGRVLLHCHAGCGPAAVVEALGLEMRDLFVESDTPIVDLLGWAAQRKIPLTGIEKAPVRLEALPKAAPSLVFGYPSGLEHRFVLDRERRQFWSPKGKRRDDPTLWAHQREVAEPPDPGTLYLCEGEKDALLAGQHGFLAVGVPGINGLTEPRAKWLREHYGGRVARVRICYDAGLQALAAARSAASLLTPRWPVEVLHWRSGTPDNTDITDLARTPSDFRQVLMQADWRRYVGVTVEQYVFDESGIALRRFSQDGEVIDPIANFSARIATETVLDDGFLERRHLRLECVMREGRVRDVATTLEQFKSGAWLLELGTGAVLEAGYSKKDHLRAAIEKRAAIDDAFVRVKAYAHLGWRLHGGHWIYLHAGGAIGVGAEGLKVVLEHDKLKRFDLPAPDGSVLGVAFDSVKDLLKLTDGRLTLPLVAAAFRAAIGACDFAVHIAGETGSFKSELASLIQRFWGRGLTRTELPLAWSATSNALIEIASVVKDAIVVIDDFKPVGGSAGVEELHRKADAFFRAQGNRSGRDRLTSDIRLRPARFPRGVALSTGEDVPRGHSCRARMLILELHRGDISPAGLTGIQRAAGEGRFAQVLASFIAWLVPQMAELESGRRARELHALRGALHLGGHRRTAEVVANLLQGFGMFLAFVRERQLIGDGELEERWKAGQRLLIAAGEAQSNYLKEEDPLNVLFGTLRSLLISGKAHVRTLDSLEPCDESSLWGWQNAMARGDCVGWIDGDDLYLEWTCTVSLVKRHCEASLVESPTMLGKLCLKRGVIVSCDHKRGGGFKTRVSISGSDRSRPDVVHVSRSSIYPEKAALSAQSGDSGNDFIEFLWSDRIRTAVSQDRLNDGEVELISGVICGGQDGQVLQGEGDK